MFWSQIHLQTWCVTDPRPFQIAWLRYPRKQAGGLEQFTTNYRNKTNGKGKWERGRVVAYELNINQQPLSTVLYTVGSCPLLLLCGALNFADHWYLWPCGETHHKQQLGSQANMRQLAYHSCRGYGFPKGYSSSDLIF